MYETAYPCLERLLESTVTGRAFALEDARRCLASDQGVQPVIKMVLDLSRALDGGQAEPGKAIVDRVGFDDRLRAVMDLVDEAIARRTAQVRKTSGSIAIATVPGEGDSGIWLWRMALTGSGYDVHDLGVKAVPLVASHTLDLAPDALAVHVATVRSRAAVHALVATMSRKGARIPLLIGGPGLDAAFAEWVAIAEGGRPYGGGVYFCDDAEEMLQVLQRVILFQPPTPSHHHETEATAPEGCAECGGCPLASASSPSDCEKDIRAPEV